MRTQADKYRTATFQYQPVDQAQNVANKRRVIKIMQQMVSAPPAELSDALRAGYHDDAQVNVTHPINELRGLAALGKQLWQPLRHAIPDVERRNDLVAGGRYRDANWIGCTGHYVGTFEQDWLGIPATRGVVAVRYAEGHELRDGKIATSYLFIDFLDLMRQAGYWPIAPSLGRETRWLPPMTHDGVILSQQDDAVSQRTIDACARHARGARQVQWTAPQPRRAGPDGNGEALAS